jgi:hypothetical protein
VRWAVPLAAKSDWWNPTHTFSSDAHNLSIDDKAMGCFCEKLASGGSVHHLEVVYADPGQKLVFSGARPARARKSLSRTL